MNYLIVEILGCLLIAGMIGTVLGWFLRGSCKKKLEDNTLDWQKKLRKDNLASKNRISLLEESFLKELSDKDNEYRVKLNQNIMSNRDSEFLEKEIISLKESLAFFESARVNSEDERDLVLDDVELELNYKLAKNKSSTNRIHQENLFLKGELDRSVSELSQCEQENKIQERTLKSLGEKIFILEKQLVLNNKKWKVRLEDRELDWVDKITLLDDVSATLNSDLELCQTKLDTSETRVENIKENLDKCEKKLNEKEKISSFNVIASKVDSKQTKKDNLKAIRGIGFMVERKLNKLGIYTFIQIVSWSENDLLRIDKELSFKGRIKREKWIEQARKIIDTQ